MDWHLGMSYSVWVGLPRSVVDNRHTEHANQKSTAPEVRPDSRGKTAIVSFNFSLPLTQ